MNRFRGFLAIYLLMLVPTSLIGAIDNVESDITGQEIVSKWFGCANSRDLKCVQRLYTTTALIHGKNEDFIGPKGIKMLLKKWYLSAPDAKLQVIHWEKEGDKIVVHWKNTCTLKDNIYHVEAQEKKMTFHGITTLVLNSQGQIEEHWVSADWRSIERGQKS